MLGEDYQQHHQQLEPPPLEVMMRPARNSASETGFAEAYEGLKQREPLLTTVTEINSLHDIALVNSMLDIEGFANSVRPQRKDGDRAIHNRRVLRILAERVISDEDAAGKTISLPLALSAIAHDAVDILEKGSSLYPQAKSDLGDMFQELRVKHEEEAEYIMSTLISTSKYEEQAEQWRGQVVNVLSSRECEEDFGLKSQLAEISGDDPGMMAELSGQMVSILNKDPISNEEVLRGIFGIRTPMSGIEDMIKVMDETELEGLLIKVAEVIDNLENPAPNVTANWRDAQELLHFFAPMLQIAGFNRMARKAYSRAHEYLVAEFYPEFHEFGSAVHSTAREFYMANINSIENALRNFGDVRSRLKSLGRFLQKAINTEEGGTTADTIGSTVVVDCEEDDWDCVKQRTEGVISTLLNLGLGFELGHTRGDQEPIIEVNFPGGSGQDEMFYFNDSGEDYQLTQKVNGSRNSGYSAVHISFRREILVGGQSHYNGYEVKVVTREGFNKNESGPRHHAIYQAGKGMGEYARLRSNKGDEARANGLLGVMLIQLDQIEARGEHFKRSARNQIVRRTDLGREHFE